MTENITIKELAETLNSAVALHRQGNKAAAREKYEKILFYQNAFDGLAKKSGRDQTHQATVVKNIFSQTYNNLGTFLEEDGLWGQALDYFRKALNYSSGNVEALTNMARVYSKQLNFGNALEAAKKAVNLNPEYLPAVIQLCRVCYNFGHTDLALKALEHVKEELASNVRLNIEYGRILERAGRLEEAREKLEKAVELGPKHVYALLNLAHVNFKLNQFDKALGNYRLILQIQPEHVQTLAGMGFLLQNMGQFREAMECYKKALSIDQTDHETLGFYASLLDLLGRPKESLEMAERLLKMPKLPERAILTGSLAKAHSERKLGRFQDSIETLKTLKPYAKNPFASSQVHFCLGKALDKLGKPGEAFREFEKANKNFLEANRALQPQSGEFEGLLDRLLANDFSFSFAKKPSQTKARQGPAFLIGPVMGGNMALGDLMAFAPKIAVYADTHVVEGIRRRLEKTEPGYPESLETLGSEEWAHLRELFEEVNQKSVFKGERGQTIEAEGTHIVNVPLILKLFPDAKFIFVGCDPRDSILNTFMKGFVATPMTINYSDLQTIARLYGKTLDLWQKYQKEIPLEVLEMKYEDLIKDPAKEIQKALKFIGYKDMKRAKKAFSVEDFFNQLALLEAQDPPGRWKNYKFHLEKVLNALKPYCKAQGYPV